MDRLPLRRGMGDGCLDGFRWCVQFVVSGWCLQLLLGGLTISFIPRTAAFACALEMSINMGDWWSIPCEVSCCLQQMCMAGQCGLVVVGVQHSVGPKLLPTTVCSLNAETFSLTGSGNATSNSNHRYE